MKPFFAISVYILTDSQGEWWETYKADGSLSRFAPGRANFNKDKTFTKEAVAIRFAKTLNRRLKVKRFDPPIRPSRTWQETIVHEQD
jgi:hypothetical protein